MTEGHGADDWLSVLEASGDPAEPVSSPTTVALSRQVLGEGPFAWTVGIAEEMTGEILATVPEHGGGPAPYGTLRRTVEWVVLTGMRALRDDPGENAVVLGEEALEGVREWARRGIPLDRVLRGVRVGHARLSREVLAAIGEDPDEARRVSDLLFHYTDLHASAVAEEYIAERDRWSGSLAALRRRTVEELLAGRAAPDAAEVLAYDPERRHVAGILWAAGSPAQPLHRYAARLAEAAGATGLLTVPVSGTALWFWMAGAKEPGRVEPPDGVRVAFGPAASGPAGFRRSHLGARQAERVALERGLVRVDHADVRVLALCTADREQADWFVAETLGDLAADDGRTAELRETLRVYLAEGRSVKAAAARLHIARNTVTYRVRRAEELLGRALPADALDLRLALEIAVPHPAAPPYEAMYVHDPS